MKKAVWVAALLAVFLLSSSSQAADGKDGKKKSKPVSGWALPVATLIDANNLTSWVRSDALFPPNIQGNFNGQFPKGLNAGFVFQDGLVFGGLVHDGSSPVVRIGGTTYPTGMTQGRILTDSSGNVTGPEDQADTNVNRVWRVRPDYKTADLTDDAAAFFQEDTSAVTPAQIEELRAQYEEDWNDWPANKGAPYVDVNGDGRYEPDVDIPGVEDAAQTLWLVANDLSPGAVSGLYGSPPIGIEEQITEWTWHSDSYPELDNMFYRQFKLIYKGTTTSAANSHIDSTYISLWSDVDDGDPLDLAGCDSTNSFAFVYDASDSDAVYTPLGMVPPAGGYVIVSGTSRYSGDATDSAVIDFGWRRGYRYNYNVPMVRFWMFWDATTISDPDLGSYDGTLQFYNFMRGALPRPEYPALDPDWTALPPPFNYQTNYPYSGDPVTQAGFVDGRYNGGPTTRRIIMTHGPITMNLHDTAEVVVATLGAIGVNYISSVSILQLYAKYAQYAFTWSVNPSSVTDVRSAPQAPARFELSQNYPNPFNPETAIRYQISDVGRVTLKIYDVLGREVRTLVDGMQSAGTHAVVFDAGDLPSGVYFYRLSTAGHSVTKKMILVK